jgi:hypothetical protein
MLRKTPVTRMVSFHPIIPGKPQVRGLLYRPSHMNMYSRLNMIGFSQQTEQERRIWKWNMQPEAHALFGIFGFFLFSLTYYNLTSIDNARKLDRKRKNFGGMSDEEVWQRNYEMEKIFKQHRELIDETRAKYAPIRPEIFDPPEGHTAWYDHTKTAHIH